MLTPDRQLSAISFGSPQVATDEFLDDMARRLSAEFGIHASTVRQLAVSARPPSEPDDDEPEAVSQPRTRQWHGRNPVIKHKCGGARHRVTGGVV
jgi:hypothetical protein